MHPLDTLSYTLTPEDALAYERLTRERRGWGQVLFYIWIACAGAALVALPQDWTGDEGSLRFYVVGAALIALFWLSANLMRDQFRRIRAYRRVPAPIAVRLEVWGDHIAIESGGRQTVLAYETIAAVHHDEAHVFISGPSAVVIVPRSAFADSAALAAFAEGIDARSRESAA